MSTTQTGPHLLLHVGAGTPDDAPALRFLNEMPTSVAAELTAAITTIDAPM